MEDLSTRPPHATRKVFGIGLSKTGTTSLWVALSELGYHAATFRHMRESGLASWIKGDFSTDELTDYDAITDLPLAQFFPSLDARFPGSKFVLTVRDAEPWLASIARQFRSNPDPPPGFLRDVRMGMYASSIFNTERFRYVHETHRRNVEWYFRDRPEDLLILDLFAEQGWSELCAFLDKPVPAIAFPNVKPGHQIKAGSQATSDRRLAFVIPVRNPQDNKVQDYRVIEAMLRDTVSSLLSQTHPNVAVIVCGHQTPAWAAEFGERLCFLDVSDQPVFAPNKNHRIPDKGLKYTLGIQYARAFFDPHLIMLLDADDYAHVELAERLLARSPTPDGVDGYLVTHGVHVLLDVDSSHRVIYHSAFEVDKFDQSCGSCRIFDAHRLYERLDAISPDLASRFADWPAPDEQRTIKLSRGRVDELWDLSKRVLEDPDGIIPMLGRHIDPRGVFKFDELDWPAAAKGCGHGNHEGPRAGAVHWRRITRHYSLRRFVSNFGAAGRTQRLPDLSLLRGGIARLLR